MAMSLGQLSESSHWLIVSTSLVFTSALQLMLRLQTQNISTYPALASIGCPPVRLGGSCGYGNLVSQAPFSSLVTGIGPSLYKSGKECGACYQIKCTKHRSCSRKPVRVVITDFCPGGACVTDVAHFDLSGTAFGAMAIPGQENKLRNAGVLQIRFARVACDYSGRTIVFRVDPGSNSNYIAMVIEFEEGDGDLRRVDLQQASSEPGEWWEMNQSWGAVWQLNPGSKLNPPFSIRLTSQYSGQTLVAKNVIPTGWKPGATYRSVVNYL
ncbi:expansin-b15 [Phtheirospermum japonicum]|uniref:Expansin-b15 n=1 Tax=Phtheirospermum japonicum TaxID=374723 RepID=A0A830D1P1_9LAMI|nr:expansin-b15 [Phtheirospermum japonicum]